MLESLSFTYSASREHMTDLNPKPYDQFLHPYIFVLKEGKEIESDYLDYSLLLLQVGKPDVLRSPLHLKGDPGLNIQFVRRQN